MTTDARLPQSHLLASAEEKQRSAADPSASAWVRANAGTGKTHVLVQRLLRLLLSGAEPRSILCLTFTKNAAAEMESRVLGKLAEWATASSEALARHLAKVLAREPRQDELDLASCLFATVTDSSGGLAIMTIHGFCERVLRRYSLEANVPPGFSVLTEEEARDALAEASAGAFASATGNALGEALNVAVAHANESEFARALQAMLAQRNAIGGLFKIIPAEDPFPSVEEKLRRLLTLTKADTKENCIARALSLAPGHILKDAATILSGGSKTDCDNAARFGMALNAADDESRFEALKAAFLTKDGGPRKSLMTAALRKRSPALNESLETARDAFAALTEKIAGLKLLSASMALLRLASAIFDRYELAKRGRGALDFDDLIGRTLSLLSRQEAAEWVLYELDARIDHILVDEAQDTSPEQWAIIGKIASDFFSGAGTRDRVPTLFAVGDEKQSIYGFQGARPELLGYFGKYFEEAVRGSGQRWSATALDLSFRTLDPVLTAVDDVSRVLPNLQQEEAIRHIAYRCEHQGLVELWEPERGEKEEKGSVWEPDEAASPADKPSQRLAVRIALQIKTWLESGEQLGSLGRPAGPGDILILLRKRAPMAGLIQSALKREGIPVAGADRVALLDEIAVQDLLALADALLQREDDLALASVLKSPLVGFTEDGLFRLAYGREASLWQALEQADAMGHLSAWRELALSATPFDFYAHILFGEEGRKAFGERLGSECFEALDEFLTLAETFSARPQASLAEFTAFVRKGASEVKRDADQAASEVRVMTVHGAKGLEANIVILADTCSTKSAPSAPIYFIGGEDGAPAIPVWAVKGTSNLPPVAEVKDDLKEAERRELERLLYVAMTRARDRLYVTGFHNGSLPEGCWYETIKAALAPKLIEAQDFVGRPIWRLGVAGETAARAVAVADAAIGLPAWCLDYPVAEENEKRILSPSKLAEAFEPGFSLLPGSGTDRKTAQSRGTLIHRLLEILPALPPENRAAAAEAIARAFVSSLPEGDRAAAIETVLTLLSEPGLQSIWRSGLAEAGLAVAEGENIILGQADLLLFGDNRIEILDYKSGTPGPSGTVRHAHVAQLACYRMALKRLYPKADISAALLGTGSGAVVKAEESLLEAALSEILGAKQPSLPGFASSR